MLIAASKQSIESVSKNTQKVMVGQAKCQRKSSFTTARDNHEWYVSLSKMFCLNECSQCPQDNYQFYGCDKVCSDAHHVNLMMAATHSGLAFLENVYMKR